MLLDLSNDEYAKRKPQHSSHVIHVIVDIVATAARHHHIFSHTRRRYAYSWKHA